MDDPVVNVTRFAQGANDLYKYIVFYSPLFSRILEIKYFDETNISTYFDGINTRLYFDKMPKQKLSGHNCTLPGQPYRAWRLEIE